MTKCELWIKIADNGLIVRECDNVGCEISTIVMEGNDAPTKLGKLIWEYIDQTDAYNNEYHIKMQIE